MATFGKDMRLISILFFAIGLCGCVTMNMNKDPSRWVTVLDSETKKPVPNLPLVYQDIKKPYFINTEQDSSANPLPPSAPEDR
jgi:hypothetical protein